MPELSFADTKSTCYLAYDAVRNESYRFSDGVVWKVLDAWATSITGFKAILIKPDDGSKNVVVLSFAGTDSLMDVAVDIAQVLNATPPQYGQALQLAEQCSARLRGSLYLTGHSLGGGLAAYSSVGTQVPANTINPAPLIGAAGFSAIFRENSQITNFIAGGSEFVSSSPGRNPGRDVAVEGRGNFFMRHTLVNTAPSVPLPVKI